MYGIDVGLYCVLSTFAFAFFDVIWGVEGDIFKKCVRILACLGDLAEKDLFSKWQPWQEIRFLQVNKC